MSSTTAVATVNAFKGLFANARYGLPVEIVLDNGPQLISMEFKEFLKAGGIKHTLCPLTTQQVTDWQKDMYRLLKRCFMNMKVLNICHTRLLLFCSIIGMHLTLQLVKLLQSCS